MSSRMDHLAHHEVKNGWKFGPWGYAQTYGYLWPWTYQCHFGVIWCMFFWGGGSVEYPWIRRTWNIARSRSCQDHSVDWSQKWPITWKQLTNLQGKYTGSYWVLIIWSYPDVFVQVTYLLVSVYPHSCVSTYGCPLNKLLMLNHGNLITSLRLSTRWLCLSDMCNGGYYEYIIWPLVELRPLTSALVITQSHSFMCF